MSILLLLSKKMFSENKYRSICNLLSNGLEKNVHACERGLQRENECE